MKKIFEKLENIFLAFMAYSFLGWVYEVSLEIFFYSKHFVNRGMFFGSYVPIYGYGALIFIALLTRMKNKKPFGKVLTPVVVTVLTGVIATVVELGVSYILDATIKPGGFQNFWGYDEWGNFERRIAPIASFRFMIGGGIVMYVIQPFLSRIGKRMSFTVKTVLSVILAIIFFTDVITTLFRLPFNLESLWNSVTAMF